MKNRIWKQAKRTGIAAAVAGTMLLGGVCQGTVSGADFDPGWPVIDQSAFWTDREKGQAELGIRVRGLNEWLMQRRLTDSSGGAGNEEVPDMDDELQEIGDPVEMPGPAENAKDQEQEETPEMIIQGTAPAAEADVETETEMGDGDEYMEELASGEAVQPENEEQEETGAGPQEGTPAGGETVEDGEETVDNDQDPDELTLITYISEYFTPELGSLPENMSAQQISVQAQNGETTEITKLKYKISGDLFDREEIFLQVPLTLREEYRFPVEKTSYLLTQEEPLRKDREGAGTFLASEEDGEDLVIAEGISPLLEMEAAKADLELSAVLLTDNAKAGKTLRYQVDITNTGKLDLTEIHLTSSFSCPKITQQWEAAQDLTVKGEEAELLELKAGENRRFFVLAPLENEQEKDLEHQIKADAFVKGRAEETIRRSASVTSPLQALKADFSVKKTADRETATPGETVTYQICIVNTGEKTLHSVVGTERFQAEGVEARFIEQEGITLNKTRTKALIEEIAPGDAVSLSAEVKIPEKMADQKLFNQVTVTSRETGERLIEAAAGVMVRGNVTAVSEEAAATENIDQEPASGQDGQERMARAASTHPRTGDDTEADQSVLLAVTAGLTVLAGIWMRKKYSRIYGKN